MRRWSFVRLCVSELWTDLDQIFRSTGSENGLIWGISILHGKGPEDQIFDNRIASHTVLRYTHWRRRFFWIDQVPKPEKRSPRGPNVGEHLRTATLYFIRWQNLCGDQTREGISVGIPRPFPYGRGPKSKKNQHQLNFFLSFFFPAHVSEAIISHRIVVTVYCDKLCANDAD